MKYLDMIGCPSQYVDWKRYHILKHIMLFFGTMIAVTFLYFGCKLDDTGDWKSKLCALAFFLLGGIGILVMAFAIALYIVAKDRRLLIDNDKGISNQNGRPFTGNETQLEVEFQNGPGPTQPFEDELGLHLVTNQLNLNIQNSARTVKITNVQDLFAFQK